MKQFAAMAFAAFVGVLVALLAYYVLVTKPGIESEFARVDNAREQAREVGRELEKAADESVERARRGFESQAQDQRRASLVAAAFMAAQSAKVALTESYMTMGRWPDDPAEIGWSDPTAYANDGARAVNIEPAGVIRIDLVDAIAPGAKVRLMPTVDPNIGAVNWRCEIEGDETLLRYLPSCRTASGVSVPALIGEASTPTPTIDAQSPKP